MRFTLAACLALTAFLGVICFLLTTKPSVVSYILLIVITILAPVCAVAGIVYGRDNLRAFCIGAALPLGLLVWSSSQELREISLEPAAYGWSKQGEQSDATLTELSMRWLLTNGNTMSSEGGMPATGMSGISGIPGQLALNPSSLARTLDKALMMTSPTCTLSIAAVVCGIMVMAIRGGLHPKENEPRQSSGNSTG